LGAYCEPATKYFRPFVRLFDLFKCKKYPTAARSASTSTPLIAIRAMRSGEDVELLLDELPDDSRSDVSNVPEAPGP